jgi:hypothetical protein
MSAPTEPCPLCRAVNAAGRGSAARVLPHDVPSTPFGCPAGDMETSRAAAFILMVRAIDAAPAPAPVVDLAAARDARRQPVIV